MNNPVVLLAVADLHLSLKAPLARSAEDDWMHCQGNYLDQLGALSKEYDAPIVCSGDLFDRWRADSELLNFLFRKFPLMYAIPGNHDLPNHQYSERGRSGYWSLVETGKIINIHPKKPLIIEGKEGRTIRLHGFPCGKPVKPLKKAHDLIQEIAVVHEYIWQEGCSHFGASENTHVEHYRKELKGYDVAVFGDNHLPFINESLINCGGFMRRKIDEISHRPSVGLIHSDNTITRHYLDVSKDQFIDPKSRMNKLDCGEGFEDFLEGLSTLGDSGLNFREAVHRKMASDKMLDGVKMAISRSLGDV